MQGVGLYDGEPVGMRRLQLRDGVREGGGQGRVDLDGGDVGDLGQQREGQRAETGTDLDDHVVGPEAGQPDDPPDGVGVDDEVLAPLLGGPQAEAGGELTDPRSAQKLRGTVPPRSFWVCCWWCAIRACRSTA